MSRLDRITDWEERAQQAGWRAAPLADNLEVSRQRLALYLRRQRGVGLVKWLRESRLRPALSLLDSESSIKKVAIELGFKEPTHFSRAFKRAFGVTPSGFLAILRARTTTFQNDHKGSILISVPAGLCVQEPRKDETRQPA